jgi:molecular chaperone DnaJ
MFTDFGSLSDIFSAFFGEGVFGAQQTRGPLRGADVTLRAEITFDDAFRGARLRLPCRVAVVCERCTGTGAEPGTQPERCPVCGGIGRVRELTQSVFGQIVREGVCATCQGSGQLIENPCAGCDGSGRLLDQSELEVDVPAGIHDGQRIRLRGEGHVGSLGGPRGDAFVIVRVVADPRFVRDGDDLHTTVQVSMIQAAIGTSVPVPSPEGDLELSIEPGTQPHDVRVLRGKGMPSLTSGRRGDLHVLVDVRVPRSLTSEQRSLLEQLDTSIGEDAYRDDDGFFDRLKSAFR